MPTYISIQFILFVTAVPIAGTPTVTIHSAATSHGALAIPALACFLLAWT